MNDFTKDPKRYLRIDAFDKQGKMSFQIPIALFSLIIKAIDLFKKPLEKELEKEGVDLSLEGISEKMMESCLEDFQEINIRSHSGEHRFKVSMSG